MPNGEDKNWLRLCAALDGFYLRYGHWPTRLRLNAYAFEDFRHLFKPETLHRLLDRFEVVVEEGQFAAESDGGRRYDNSEGYGGEPPVPARKWLGMWPDAGGPPATEPETSAPSKPDVRYDLSVGGRQVYWLTPAEVVREVVRFLAYDQGLSREAIEAAAGQSLLRPAPRDLFEQAGWSPGPDSAALARHRNVLRMPGGESFVLKDGWEDFRSVLYGLEASLPFGFISWKETSLLSKRAIVHHLGLQDGPGQRQLKRHFHSPVQAAGPITNAYWVSAEGLLAGEYPFAADYTEGEAKLQRMLDAGVTCFVDLTHPSEGLTGYYFPEGLPGRPEHHRHPMRPAGVPDRSTVAAVLDTIDDALMRQQVVYVHDRGGLGRSAMVVGCHLTRRGIFGEEAIAMVNRLAAAMPKVKGKPLPVRKEQQRIIRQWEEHS